MPRPLRFAVTLGDPAGIGPEIALGTLLSPLASNAPLTAIETSGERAASRPRSLVPECRPAVRRGRAGSRPLGCRVRALVDPVGRGERSFGNRARRRPAALAAPTPRSGRSGRRDRRYRRAGVEGARSPPPARRFRRPSTTSHGRSPERRPRLPDGVSRARPPGRAALGARAAGRRARAHDRVGSTRSPASTVTPAVGSFSPASTRTPATGSAARTASCLPRSPRALPASTSTVPKAPIPSSRGRGAASSTGCSRSTTTRV
jgi:hypothetical protein